jgi:hypothetical protein
MASMIVAGERTLIGKFGEAFKDVPAVSLGAHSQPPHLWGPPRLTRGRVARREAAGGSGVAGFKAGG